MLFETFQQRKLQPQKTQELHWYQDSFMQDFFDHIDLGDNDIKKLGNLTLLKRYHLLVNIRLKTLNLSNNRITKLTDVSDSLPNIENLILMNNRLTDINELYQLKHCKKLKRLILHGNLIT